MSLHFTWNVRSLKKSGAQYLSSDGAAQNIGTISSHFHRLTTQTIWQGLHILVLDIPCETPKTSRYGSAPPARPIFGLQYTAHTSFISATFCPQMDATHPCSAR